MKIYMVLARLPYLPERVIQVEPVFDIAPHLASVATFAVGRIPHRRGWRMHNLETGMYIDQVDRPTKAACIAAGKRFLRGIDALLARKLIEEAQ